MIAWDACSRLLGSDALACGSGNCEVQLMMMEISDSGNFWWGGFQRGINLQMIEH
jgi:hypothetical protein